MQVSDAAAWATVITGFATVIYTIGTFLLWVSTRRTAQLVREQLSMQNTAVRSSSQHSILSAHRDLFLHLAENGELARLLFPLRGAVVCGCCGTPLTACWSTGRTARYAYYLCPKRGCASYRKSIPRETIEGEFAALLRTLQPTEKLAHLARAMFEDLWNHRLASAEGRGQVLRAELAKIEKQVDQFLDRIADTEMPSVIAAYESRIRKLEEQKAVLANKIKDCGRPIRSFDETVRTALDFLASPWNLWASKRLEDKRAVLKLAFSDRLAYVRNEGFRTANLSLPFKALEDFSGVESRMARP